MFKRKLSHEAGFTLVELLIVVAIIGVLSTVGIPSFSRMLQKSRKAEAQTNLGNLFTIQSAFGSEYGVYGTNLLAMGFQIDGIPAALTYTVGVGTAGSCIASPIAAQLPAVGTTQATAVANAISNYYVAGAVANQRAGRFTAAMTIACPAAAFSAVGVVPPTMLVNAAGVIANGADKDTGAGAARVDTWTMNEGRTLVNTIDGVQ